MSLFPNTIGQPQAVEILTRILETGKIAPAYLFVGTEGIGRTLTAKRFIELLMIQGISDDKKERILHQLQEGNHPDLLWVEPTYQHQGKLVSVKEAETLGISRKSPPQIRIEQVREITQFLSRPPLLASRSIVIIESVHTMAESASNALLKTLEEPGQAVIILIAPSIESILITLVSRCQKIPFYRLSEEDIEKVLKKEGYGIILQDPALLSIGQGSAGGIISAFEQLENIPETLRQRLENIPQKPLQLLELARDIDKELDTQNQLWLIDYLQSFYWEKYRNNTLLKELEKTRKYLLSYVQPRLVWECTLLNFLKIDLSSE